MSFGEHLEELRACVIRALVGVVVSTVLCFYFGDRIIEWLTAPYYAAMTQEGFEPRMLQVNPTEAFLEYFKVSLEFGLVLSAPWVLYQVWTFVAVGLYPNERRVFQYFAPASIGLFLAGAGFLVIVVLFGLLKFLIGMSTWFPLPGPDGNALTRWLAPPPAATATAPAAPPLRLPVLATDPPAPKSGDAWVRSSDGTLNVVIEGRRYTTRLTPSDRQQFVQPFFTISEYLSFVTGMALAFGLGFQIPVVVVFLIAAGIVSAAMLASARRHVLLGLAVVAAVVTPSPDVGSMLLLVVPMALLFESGLFIGKSIERRRTADDARS
ncbi:MAG: twin-arginine translocase subunit TatC [Phycisphaerae bacterium]|nr:twin-arginine translocase subunit TatC [Phycisphaerae bacterium]